MQLMRLIIISLILIIFGGCVEPNESLSAFEPALKLPAQKLPKPGG